MATSPTRRFSDGDVRADTAGEGAPAGSNEVLGRRVTVKLCRIQQDIDPDREDWDLLKRLGKIFNFVVGQERQNFPHSCEYAFQSILTACNDRQWKTLSREGVRDDLTRLAVYVGDTIATYAIAQNEQWSSGLIQHCIDIHSVDRRGNTPLHIAAGTGRVHLIPELCNVMEDPNQLNHASQTPLELAIQAGQSEVVEKLIEINEVELDCPIFLGVDRKIQFDSIGFAVARGEIACIEKLLGAKRCPLTTEYKGIGNLLHVAIHFNQNLALKHLLENSEVKQALIKGENSEGLNPLNFAATLGELESIKLLFQKGANIKCKCPKGRQPIHYAALGLHLDAIQLLAALGAKIDPSDKDGFTPVALLKNIDGTVALDCRLLLKNLKLNKESRKQFPRMHFNPPRNLVFRGGGAKGPAFLGAVLHLNEQGYLEEVRRVAGSSAGAITAALIATGYPMNESEKILMDTNLMDFLDPKLATTTLAEFKKHPLYQSIRTLRDVLGVAKNPLGFTLNQIQKLYRCTGICDGEVFRVWMEEKIRFATRDEFGKDHLTFGEFATLVKLYPNKYKHLHVYGTRIGTNPKIYHWSSEDPASRDIIIVDAVKISMSFPGVYKPHTIHVLEVEGTTRKRVDKPERGSFLDGGMLYNLPMETFDQKRYLTQDDLKEEGECPKFNKETLGFSLFSSSTKPPETTPIKNVKELLEGICYAVMNTEEAIRDLNPYNKFRIVPIDVKDVGTLDFGMSIATKRMLVASGREAIEKFIRDRNPPATSRSPEMTSKEMFEQKVQGKKDKLQRLRNKASPNTYPCHFDDLLEMGYLHLFDYLLQMKGLETHEARLAHAEQLPFSEISHIILETKQVMIDAFTGICQNKPFLFIIGSTGSGKSTTFAFLKGDKMRLENGTYDSPTQGLIGHGATTSYTFRPNLHIGDDLTIVDYPGFDDSNGPLIALGMECALKSLVHSLHPKVLVVDPIENIVNGRARRQWALGSMLKRLFGSTEQFFLGMTKYSEDSIYIEIKAIEEKQKERGIRFQTIEGEIQRNKDDIQKLEEHNDPVFQEMKKRCEEDLARKEADLAQMKIDDLLDTRDKTKRQNDLKERESEILIQMGLKGVIPLVDLEYPIQRDRVLGDIVQIEEILHPVLKQVLDAGHKMFLEDRFEHDLLPLIEQQTFEEVDLSDLERATLESSLINALLSVSHPEIGNFLHLPEIDHAMAQNFSKKVVEKCHKKLINRIIQGIDLDSINVIKMILSEESSKEYKEIRLAATPGKFEALDKSQSDLMAYVLVLTGKRKGAMTSAESIDIWDGLRKKIEAVQADAEAPFEWSKLGFISACIGFGLPLLYNKYAREAAVGVKVREVLDQRIDTYCNAIESIHGSLLELEGLKSFITKKEDIDSALQLFPLSFESFVDLDESIKTTVDCVKELYGNTVWTAQVNTLRNRILERSAPTPEVSKKEIEEQAIAATAATSSALAAMKEAAIAEAAEEVAITRADTLIKELAMNAAVEIGAATAVIGRSIVIGTEKENACQRKTDEFLRPGGESSFELLIEIIALAKDVIRANGIRGRNANLEVKRAVNAAERAVNAAAALEEAAAALGEAAAPLEELREKARKSGVLESVASEVTARADLILSLASIAAKEVAAIKVVKDEAAKRAEAAIEKAAEAEQKSAAMRGDGAKFPLLFDDLIATLVFGQDPSLQIIKISGPFSQALSSFVKMSGFLERNALLFQYADRFVVLKRYSEREEPFLKLINEHKGMFKESQIEVLGWEGRKLVVQQPVSFSLEVREVSFAKELAEFKKEVGLKMTTPLEQMKIMNAVQPLLVQANCFRVL